MLKRLLRYIRGYIQLKISGELPERMLTLLSRRGFTFWDIRRHGESIYLSLFASDLPRIRRTRRECGVSLHIAKRRGLPFIIRRYRGRYGLAVGFLLFLVVNSVASMFIWNISVTGNTSLSAREVTDTLKSMGISEGSLISGIDCETARIDLSLKHPEISWASLNIEGSRLTVNISERVPIDKKTSEPCDLVASRNGVIDSVNVLTGLAVVKSGDTVAEGQVLASGRIAFSDGTETLVAADGAVYAYTSRRLAFEQPYVFDRTVCTGKSVTRRVLGFFGLNIPLYLGSVRFPYKAERSDSCLGFGDAYLPIVLHTAVFRETAVEQVRIGVGEAREMAGSAVDRLCELLGDGIEITDQTDSYTEGPASVTLTRTMTVRENIAVPRPIASDGAPLN